MAKVIVVEATDSEGRASARMFEDTQGDPVYVGDFRIADKRYFVCSDTPLHSVFPLENQSLGNHNPVYLSAEVFGEICPNEHLTPPSVLRFGCSTRTPPEARGNTKRAPASRRRSGGTRCVVFLFFHQEPCLSDGVQ